MPSRQIKDILQKNPEKIDLVARPDPSLLNSSDDSGGLGGGDDDDEIMAEDGLGDSTQLHSETIKINNIAGGGRSISLTCGDGGSLYKNESELFTLTARVCDFPQNLNRGTLLSLYA